MRETVDLLSERYRVQSLPGLNDATAPAMYAGHIPVDSNSNGNLFFWLIESKKIEKSNKTVIWLNGGPGCSSFDGAFMEVGPYSLTDGLALKSNPGAWNQLSNLVFVDQPVGTGFSYVDDGRYLHELDEMSTHFVKFLRGFFDSFPELERTEIYISGESYAGQFIPYIAKAILERNNARGREELPWMLKGLLIGNGWIDPKSQYESYLPYMIEQGIVSVDDANYTVLQNQLGLCRSAMQRRGNQINIAECEKILSDALELSSRDTRDKSCINMYDIRLRDTFPDCGMNWPPTVPFLEPYLRRTDVMQSFNLNRDRKKPWVECSGAVSAAFRAKHSLPSVNLLPDLLKHIKILLFSGDKDLICNHLGTESLVKAMNWGGSFGIDSELKPWFVGGEVAGELHSARNLTYVLFYNASHMVPYDKPIISRSVLHNFIFEKSQPGYEDLLLATDGRTPQDGIPQIPQVSDHRVAMFFVATGIVFCIATGIIIFNRARHRRKLVEREETDIMLERFSLDS